MAFSLHVLVYWLWKKYFFFYHIPRYLEKEIQISRFWYTRAVLFLVCFLPSILWQDYESIDNLLSSMQKSNTMVYTSCRRRILIGKILGGMVGLPLLLHNCRIKLIDQAYQENWNLGGGKWRGSETPRRSSQQSMCLFMLYLYSLLAPIIVYHPLYVKTYMSPKINEQLE